MGAGLLSLFWLCPVDFPVGSGIATRVLFPICSLCLLNYHFAAACLLTWARTFQAHSAPDPLLLVVSRPHPPNNDSRDGRVCKNDIPLAVYERSICCVGSGIRDKYLNHSTRFLQRPLVFLSLIPSSRFSAPSSTSIDFLWITVILSLSLSLRLHDQATNCSATYYINLEGGTSSSC
jgi:hypothetical protein